MKNLVILIGRVGGDPVIKTFDNGDKIASLSLATTERGYKTKDGREVPERTEWHNIQFFRGLATVVEMYVKKGALLYIEGKIKTRNWEKDGVKHYVTEIIADEMKMLGSKSGGQNEQANEPEFSQPEIRQVNDDLPF
jgi:single-strand DNA-binding protein